MAIPSTNNEYLCPITFDSLSLGAFITVPCGHNFSITGMQSYLSSKNIPLNAANDYLKKIVNVNCPLCRTRITQVFENTEYEKAIQLIVKKNLFKKEKQELLLCPALSTSMAQNTVLLTPCSHHVSRPGIDNSKNCPKCKEPFEGTVNDLDFQNALVKLQSRSEQNDPMDVDEQPKEAIEQVAVVDVVQESQSINKQSFNGLPQCYYSFVYDIKHRLFDSPGGIIYGPPQIDKIAIAYKIGKMLGIHPDDIHFCSGASLRSKWVGGTEKNIRRLYESTFHEYGSYDPKSLVIINNAEEILTRRRAYGYIDLNGFVSVLDEIHRRTSNVITLALTDNIEEIDSAVKRPGRLGALLDVNKV